MVNSGLKGLNVTFNPYILLKFYEVIHFENVTYVLDSFPAWFEYIFMVSAAMFITIVRES